MRFKWDRNLKRHLKLVHKSNVKGIPKRIQVLKPDNPLPQFERKKQFNYLCKKIHTTPGQKEIIKELSANAESILDTSKVPGGYTCVTCKLKFVDEASINEHISKH